MGSKTKKIKAAGKFGPGYGVTVRNRFNHVEAMQRKKHQSPFHPRGKMKRIAAGIWQCTHTGKICAGEAYVPGR